MAMHVLHKVLERDSGVKKLIEEYYRIAPEIVRKIDLFRCGEKVNFANLLEVHAYRISRKHNGRGIGSTGTSARRTPR